MADDPASLLAVRMCEIGIVIGRGEIGCQGLGSCVGVVAYDSAKKIAGVAHVMLPKSFEDTERVRPAKFADVAIPTLVKQIEQAGGSRRNLRVALAGGAKVLRLGSGTEQDIGSRNGEALLVALQEWKLEVVASDLGGTKGRTIRFNLEDRILRVRSLGQEEQILCSLDRRRFVRADGALGFSRNGIISKPVAEAA